MLELLRRNLVDASKAVGPLMAVTAVLLLLLTDSPAAMLLQLFAGALFAIVGMALLFIGIDLGILPMGRYVGAALPAKRSLGLIVFVAFSLGFATTVAEPDVLVLSEMVKAASGGAIGALPFELWGAVGVSALLQVAVVHVGFPNVAFGTTPLTLDQWLACVALASIVLWASELRKLARRRPTQA